MSDDLPRAQPALHPHLDRSGSLIFGGVLLILEGLMALLTAALVLLHLASANRTESLSALLSGDVYLGATIYLLWSGIGLLMGRRWALALTRAVAAVWLILGTIGIAALALIVFGVRAEVLSDLPDEVRRTVAIVLAAYGALLLLAHVVVPLLLTLVLRGPDVKATCEAKDPVARWSDRRPLPILGACVALLVMAAASAAALLFHRSPFFGQIWTGAPAIAIQLTSSLLFLVATVQLFWLRLSGWWLSGILLLIWGLSMIVTFQTLNAESWAGAMHLPESTPAQMQLLTQMLNQAGAWSAAGTCIAGAYLMYLKKFLRPVDEVASP